MLSIRNHLFEMQDVKYKEFHSKLMPTIDPDTIIGVRTPLLRAFAKELRGTKEAEQTYTIRYGIGVLMKFYLDEEFQENYLKMVALVPSQEYYVRMMIAWYFATALAKQYDAAVPYLQEHRLDPWTHNKTIQKAIESYRITEEQKAYLRRLKVTV